MEGKGREGKKEEWPRVGAKEKSEMKWRTVPPSSVNKTETADRK